MTMSIHTVAIVELPYNLKDHELKLESIAQEQPTDFDNLMIDLQLDYKEDEVERVVRAATVLKQRFPEAPFSVCLESAMIWERG